MPGPVNSLQVHDWRPGSTRADLEEERAAQRRAAGIDANSDDEFSGLGAAALTAGQRGRRRRPRSPREGDGLGMHSDGSFRGESCWGGACWLLGAGLCLCWHWECSQGRGCVARYHCELLPCGVCRCHCTCSESGGTCRHDMPALL
jgi:hypothetical protein